MRKRILPITLAVLSLFSLTSCMSEEPMMPQMSVSSEAITRPGPEENFYGYINYDFLTKGQIPYNKNGLSESDILMDAVEEYVSGIIDRCAASDQQKGTFEDMIKEVYLQYKDLGGREEVGVAPLMPAVGMVESCKNVEDFITVMGALYQEYGVYSFFRFIVEPDAADNSKYALYMMNMYTCGNMKENFTKTDAGISYIGDRVYQVLSALEVDKTEAKKRAQDVVKVIYDIMTATTDSDKFNDSSVHYNPRTKEEVKTMFSNIDVDHLLSSFGYDADSMIVFDLPQAEMINEKLKEENLRALQDYLLLCLMHIYERSLPPKFLGGMNTIKTEDLEKKAKQYTANMLEEEVGFIYGSEVCTEEVMTAVDKIVKKIQDSLRELIENCDRLSENSKEKFLLKMDNMVINLGYNKDYTSPFKIMRREEGGSLLTNSVNIYSTKTKTDIAKLKTNAKPSRVQWSMTPITVNAVYNPTLNTMTIPAVNMSEPALSLEDNEYYNLGKLGYCIAHEMNHAFDSNGFEYNDTGCYKPGWIGEEDTEAYKKVMDKFVDYYDHYLIMDVYAINGKQTLGENIADCGAVQCLLNTTDDKAQLEEIFKGMGESWAELVRIKNVTMQIDGDEHSPAEARVNAVVSVMDKFYLVYDVKEGDKMYVAPENRVRVW